MKFNHSEILKAHEILEKHYKTQADKGELKSIAKAIFHANRIDWIRGVNEWIDTFKIASSSLNLQLCQTLFDITNELIISQEFYLGIINKYKGIYYQNLTRFDEAIIEYAKSIKNFDIALSKGAVKVECYKNCGDVFYKLAELYAVLDNYNKSIESFQNAIKMYDLAIAEPDSHADHFKAQHNRGASYLGLGELLAELMDFENAILHYQNALQIFTGLLKIDSNSILIHDNRANTLRNLGEAYLELNEIAKASTSYELALEAYKILEVIDTVYLPIIYNHEGITYLRYGQLQWKISKYKEAIESHKNALKLFEKAIEVKSDFEHAYFNQGLVYQSVGNCISQIQPISDESKKFYWKAIKSFDSAIRFASRYLDPYYMKGNVLKDLGKQRFIINDYQEALNLYNQSLETFHKALQLSAATSIDIQFGNGLLLLDLGELNLTLERYDEARACFNEALTLFDAVLEVKSMKWEIFCEKAHALIGLGNIASQNQESNSLEYYQEAIVYCERALEHKKDNSDSQLCKCLAYRKIIESQFYLLSKEVREASLDRLNEIFFLLESQTKNKIKDDIKGQLHEEIYFETFF